MPLPEKEYFALDEIEERWGIQRRDTIYYAENGLLEIAMRVVGVVIETGIIETEPNGRWFRLLEDHRRYSGLLTLRACDLAVLLRRGSMTIRCFRAGEERYGDIVEPEDGIEVHACDLVVTRAERDRFERAHALDDQVKSNGKRAMPVMPLIDCSDDGGWIKVRGREYLFSGLLQKTAIRRLYEAWESGTPRLNMQALLEDIESGSRHISQVFGTVNRSWREIVGYGRGYVWLKADGSAQGPV
jgi:hypothetical protein